MAEGFFFKEGARWGISEELTFEQSSELSKEVDYWENREKCVLGRRNSKHNGPEDNLVC